MKPDYQKILSSLVKDFEETTGIMTHTLKEVRKMTTGEFIKLCGNAFEIDLSNCSEDEIKEKQEKLLEWLIAINQREISTLAFLDQLHAEHGKPKQRENNR